MDADVSTLLSARVASSTVDFGTAAATDAEADESTAPRDLFSNAEVDFETRNRRQARDTFQRNSTHDSERVAEFLKSQESPQQAKDACTEQKSRAQKAYAPAVGGVLTKIEGFMKVGDVAMKSAPESAGLVWMGIRLCMHSVQDDFATFNLFIGAASDIVGILISCRAYGKMYGGDGGHKGLPESQKLHERVVSYIPFIYSQILEFSYQMRKHMGRSVGVRFVKGILSSAVIKFKAMIDGIRSGEQTMSGYAQQAFQQLSQFYQELSLHKQDSALGNQNVMMQDLTAIKDMLVVNESSKKLQEDYIKELENKMKSLRKKTPLDLAKDKFEANKSKLVPTTSSANSATVLERARSLRSEGTCEWIFSLEPYEKWKAPGTKGMLWVQGNGGMGKSGKCPESLPWTITDVSPLLVLVARIIDRLQKDAESSEDVAAQWFICSSREEPTRTPDQIQKQLVYGLYELVNSLESAEALEKANKCVDQYLGSEDTEGASKKTATIEFDDTYMNLIEVLEKRIFLVVDALDECEDRQSSNFLQAFKGMTDSSEEPEAQIKILLCSRPESDIVDELSECPTIKIQEHNGPDIEHDAEAKVNKLPGLSHEERKLACATIVEKAQGLFRCVAPAIAFLEKPWKRPLKNVLQRLPDGLVNSYQRILQQTDPNYLDLLKTALHWCILGKRTPTTAEIMDDFTCAYDQEDGSNVNPYDQINDPTKSVDNRLTYNQSREAGGNTFLEIDTVEREVKIRHTTVKDFSLPTKPPTSTHNKLPDGRLVS